MGNGWAAAAELVMRTAAALRWRERGCVRRRWGRPTPLTPRRTKGASAQACDGRVDRGDAVPHRLENIGEGLAVRVVACVARRRGARARTRGPCARWWHGVAGRGGDGVRVCACARYLCARAARAPRGRNAPMHAPMPFTAGRVRSHSGRRLNRRGRAAACAPALSPSRPECPRRSCRRSQSRRRARAHAARVRDRPRAREARRPRTGSRGRTRCTRGRGRGASAPL